MPLLEVTIPAGRCIVTLKLSNRVRERVQPRVAAAVTTPIVVEGGP